MHARASFETRGISGMGAMMGNSQGKWALLMERPRQSRQSGQVGLARDTVLKC